MTSLFNTPSMPSAPKPVPAPDIQDAQARVARRKAMEDARTRGGREGTILDAGSYGSYAAKQLGTGSPS